MRISYSGCMIFFQIYHLAKRNYIQCIEVITYQTPEWAEKVRPTFASNVLRASEVFGALCFGLHTS